MDPSPLSTGQPQPQGSGTGSAGKSQQPGAESPSGGLNGKAKLAEDFDTFLNILVTQMQNQDPLEPMKSQEFTTQLVQFSTVEQAIATNEKLDRMLQSQAANRATQAVSFIGKDVAMEGNQIALDGGEADFAYTLEGDAESALVEITDSAGQVVRTIDGATDAGRHEVAWNGETNNGTALPDGTYNVQVRAVDADNNTVKATTESRGRVSGFELRDDSIFLQVGDVEVPFDQVTAVYNDSGSGGSLPDPDA